MHAKTIPFGHGLQYLQENLLLLSELRVTPAAVLIMIFQAQDNIEHSGNLDNLFDSLNHPFDREGKKHMEYVKERGEFDDVPLDAMRATFREEYPNMGSGSWEAGDFEREVDAEVGAPGLAEQGTNDGAA